MRINLIKCRFWIVARRDLTLDRPCQSWLFTQSWDKITIFDLDLLDHLIDLDLFGDLDHYGNLWSWSYAVWSWPQDHQFTQHLPRNHSPDTLKVIRYGVWLKNSCVRWKESDGSGLVRAPEGTVTETWTGAGGMSWTVGGLRRAWHQPSSWYLLFSLEMSAL